MARTFGDPNEIEIDDLIEIKDIQRVKLEPGDVLVVRYERPMSIEMAQRIKDRIRRVFPNNDVLVFDRNPTLSVIEAGK